MSITIGGNQDERGLYTHMLECCGCDAIVEFHIGERPTATELKEIAKKLGWLVGRREYCKTCQQTAEHVLEAKKEMEATD